MNERIYCPCAEALFSNTIVNLSLAVKDNKAFHMINKNVEVYYCPVCGKKLPNYNIFTKSTSSEYIKSEDK